MSAAQLLLRRLLDQAGGASETGYVLVIEGEGLDNLPSEMPTPTATYGVHRVSTELGLRHLLWKAKGAPLIVVMPEDVARRIQKSPDLLRRAKNQRVHALSVNDVLEVVLGVRVVGADAPYMQQLALEHVEKLGLAMSQRTLPTVIDRKLLTELLVDVSVGEQVRTRTAAQLLAAWVQQPPQWSNNISQLVRDALPTLHGDEGRLLAWSLAAPETRLRELVTYGAVLTVEAAELPKPAWGPLWKAATEAPIEMDRRILRRAATRLAEETLSLLGDSAGALLSGADRIGRECLTPTQLQTSRVLPLAFSDRCHSLAQQAAAGKPISSADISWLAAHRASRMHRTELAVLEGMGRVSRYLDQPLTLRPDLLDQVREYQRGGAFADLAMLQLRRSLASSVHYHAEASLTFLAGLLQLLRQSGYQGLVVVLDEVETIQRMNVQTREKSLNALRQLMDMLAKEELPGLYLVVTGTRDFFEGYKGLKALAPLYQRVNVNFDEDPRWDNLLAPQVRLLPFTEERLLTVGRRVRDLYAVKNSERVFARVDDTFLTALVSQVTTGFGGKVSLAPRLFLRELVDVMDRVDLHEDYEPSNHYKLDLQDGKLTPEELAAKHGKAFEPESVPDEPDDAVDPDPEDAAKPLLAADEPKVKGRRLDG